MSGKRGSSDFLSGLRVVKEENAVVRQSEAKAGPIHVAATTAESQDSSVLRAPAHTTPAPRQKGREGKVSITQWVDPVVRKQIAQISLDEDKDQYELINEALNLLFEKYGRSTIA
jgi:hypothetical protein